VTGATSIMYGSLDKNGAFNVQFFCDTSGILSTEDIIDLIKNRPETTAQPEPFWCTVRERHRLVYHLDVPNWYFPDYEEIQKGALPFRLKTPDPVGNFGQPYLIPQSRIIGGDDLRIKTIYVDDAYNEGTNNMPFVADLLVNVWQDPADPNSWKTPIVIDPGGGGWPV